jgi:multisubunit Na+/H+ antiporter MnhB subunit
MQVAYRKNPKTTGWARRAAIALLVGAGAMLVTLPLAFFILLTHYNTAYPHDTQNILSALTVGVVIGLVVAGGCMAATLVLSFFIGLPTVAAAD